MADPGDSRGHTPGARWQFDATVADVFDDMLARSIPDYATMRRLVTQLAVDYTQPGHAVVGLGCSRGEALYQVREAVQRRYGADGGVTYYGLEVSEPMYRAASQRFAGVPGVTIEHTDVRRQSVQPYRPAVVLAVLTLQFIPINYRAHVLRDIYQALPLGGALLLVEKVLGATAEIDATMVRHYHVLKESQGYSGEEVARKAAALEGVLVPLTAGWNADALRHAGFREVDCFWRYLNFGAWVAVK